MLFDSQISFRPLKDTSPASLPHTSVRPPARSANSTSSSSTPTTSTVQTPRTASQPPTASLQPSSSRSPTQQSVPLSPELPKADPPIAVSPPNRPARLNSGGPTGGGKATTAHVGTNAHPTLSQPPNEYNTPLNDGPIPSTYTDDMDDEGDGSSIMGRAANIATSARGLLGGWWYGDTPPGQPQQSLGQASNEVEGLPAQSGVGGTGGDEVPGVVGGLQRKWSGKHRRGTSMG